MKIGTTDSSSRILPPGPSTGRAGSETVTGLGTSLRFPASELIVLTSYLILTILMTWPIVLHLAEAIPGDGFDGWQNYWNLWWVKQALLVDGTQPYFTTYLDAPGGTSLLFHTLNLFNGLWTLPIQLNSGLALAYNAVVFLSFVFAGYGAYLLSLFTLSRFIPTGRGLRLAAFVGGLVFTMSPFHMAHLLGHMQVFSMIWPPFYALWLLRTLDPWSQALEPPARQWRNAALSSLFLILASLVALYHTLYLLIFTGLVLLWTMWRKWRLASRTRSNLRRRLTVILRPLLVVLALGLGFVIVLSPVFIPMIRAASRRPDLETGLLQNITLSADLLAFITPSEMHPLWGEWARSMADNFSSTTSERLVFAGFVPLALAIYIAVRARSSIIVRFWLLVTTIFFVIALGPFLHIGGRIAAIGAWPMPMPYLLLYYAVPFLDLTRSLSRYDLMVMLGLGVLVAMALAQLTVSYDQAVSDRTRQPQPASRSTFRSLRFPRIPGRASLLIPLLAILLICFEFLPAPYPFSKIDTPQFYFDIAADAEPYTIAELPMNWDRPTPLLHQTTHGKRLLTAYTSRDNPLELANRIPVFQHWRNLGRDIIDHPLDQVAPTIFSDFNLRYIVLDFWQMPPGPERSSTERWVAAALPGAAPIYDDGRLKVYQSPPREETRPYLSLGEGWNDRQAHSDDLVTRSFSADQPQAPELFIHHPQGRLLAFEISAAADEPGQTITVYANDEPVGSFQPGPGFETQTLLLPATDQALVKLTFRADNSSGNFVVKRVTLKQGD
jgi:hypothetical protein